MKQICGILDMQHFTIDIAITGAYCQFNSKLAERY